MQDKYINIIYNIYPQRDTWVIIINLYKYLSMAPLSPGVAPRPTHLITSNQHPTGDETLTHLAPALNACDSSSDTGFMWPRRSCLHHQGPPPEPRPPVSGARSRNSRRHKSRRVALKRRHPGLRDLGLCSRCSFNARVCTELCVCVCVFMVVTLW